jgi:type I restriction enzyme S subunit
MLRTMASSGYIESLAKGIRERSTSFDAATLANLQLPCPALDEQRRIADFLDAETARIDLLIAARHTQTARLGELWDSRLAVAVDEQVCRHGWIPLRRIVSSIEQGWSPQCDDANAEPREWAVLRTSAVSSGEFMPMEHKRLPSGIEPDLRYMIRDGDILLTRGSGSPNHVGAAALAVTEGRRLLLSDLLYRIRLASDWSPDFVALALRSGPVRGLMGLLLRGQSGQTIKLRAEDVRAIEIPAVPPVLQSDIAADLSAQRASIRSASRCIEVSLSVLAEHRQALITAAVTGQIDVTTARGAAV